MTNLEYVKSRVGKTPATDWEIKLYLQNHGLDPEASVKRSECERIMEEANVAAIKAHMFNQNKNN